MEHWYSSDGTLVLKCWFLTEQGPPAPPAWQDPVSLPGCTQPWSVGKDDVQAGQRAEPSQEFLALPSLLLDSVLPRCKMGTNLPLMQTLGMWWILQEGSSAQVSWGSTGSTWDVPSLLVKMTWHSPTPRQRHRVKDPSFVSSVGLLNSTGAASFLSISDIKSKGGF